MEKGAKHSTLRRRMLMATVALLLTGTFMYVRFPYDRLIPSTQVAFEKATGLSVQIAALSSWPTLRGPGLSAGPLRLEFPAGARLDLDEVRVRPAWSFSWLRGEPSLVVEFQDDLLRGESLVALGEVPSLSGHLLEINLSMLPPKLLGKGVALEGISEVSFDLQLEETGTIGQLNVAAVQGSVEHPQLPLTLPFVSIDGDIQLGGDAWLTVRSLEVDSPLLKGDLAGTVGAPPGSELDIYGEFETDPQARPALNGGGFTLSRGGTLNLAIHGSAARPVFR